jgi:hypothetical protein
MDCLALLKSDAIEVLYPSTTYTGSGYHGEIFLATIYFSIVPSIFSRNRKPLVFCSEVEMQRNETTKHTDTHDCEE